MIVVRKAADRGHAKHDWLDTHFSFSFAEYHDPAHMGFRSLRVINEDWIDPGRGFGTHPHRDMEIITYVLEGALAHKDSMGNGSTIRPGDVQFMRAGSGIRHSEFNPSDTESCHLYQIWIHPSEVGLEPGYDQRHFEASELSNGLCLLISSDGRDGTMRVHQDANLYASKLDQGQRVEHILGDGRHAWIQVARGEVTVNGQSLSEGDGASVSEEDRLEFVATSPSEFLLFDLA